MTHINLGLSTNLLCEFGPLPSEQWMPWLHRMSSTVTRRRRRYDIESGVSALSQRRDMQRMSDMQSTLTGGGGGR